MRNKIVAGNWKMNKTFKEAENLIDDIVDWIEQQGGLKKTSVILFPPALYLELTSDIAAETEILTGCQNISPYPSGAYTGEISAPMLESMKIGYCIAGHSERRKYFNETDELIGEKVKAALDHNIIPVFCCGEQLEERENERHFNTVRTQLENSVFKLEADDFEKIIIAYEPVWAIGTGKNATPVQAQQMHSFIRDQIAKKYDSTLAENFIILYGGSCNSKNAQELFSGKDVDGGLIGGASLDAKEFCSIIRIAEEIQSE